MKQEYKILQIIPSQNYCAVFKDRNGVSTLDVAAWALVEFDDGYRVVWGMICSGGPYLEYAFELPFFVAIAHKSNLVLEDFS